jgi:hypothetical protein
MLTGVCRRIQKIANASPAMASTQSTIAMMRKVVACFFASAVGFHPAPWSSAAGASSFRPIAAESARAASVDSTRTIFLSLLRAIFGVPFTFGLREA